MIKRLIIPYILSGLAGLAAILLVSLSYRASMVGSDAGRVLYFSKLFLLGETREAFRTLEPFLMVTIYASLMTILGTGFKLVVVQGVASGMLLLLIIDFLRKRYGNLAGVIGCLTMLTSYLLIERGNELVPYPLFLLFNTLGVLMLVRYEEESKNKYIILAAIFSVFSVFVFNLALTGLLIPGGYYLGKLIFSKERKKTLLSLAKFYLVAGVLILPWFVWRYAEAGMDFYKNPVHWLGKKYWSKFNLLLWDRARPGSVEYYRYFWERGMEDILGLRLAYVLALLGIIKIRFKGIYVFWILATLLPLGLGKLPTETRYLYSILPPLVILASVGLSVALRKLASRQMKVGIVLYGVSCLLVFANNLRVNEEVIAANRRIEEEIGMLTKQIKPGKRIYFRSLQFQGILSNNLMIAPQYMREDEAASFVTWVPADVKKIMKRYEIGYVLLYRNEEAEKEFSGWIKFINKDFEVRYVDEIKSSEMFRQLASSANYVLYEYLNP